MSSMYLPEPPRTNGMRDLRYGTTALLSDKIGSAFSPRDADIGGNRWRRGAAVEFPQRRRQGTVCRSEAQPPWKSLAGTLRKQRVTARYIADA